MSDHNDNDRSVTNSLIDLGEVSKYVSDSKRLKVIASEWTDAVIGWQGNGPSTKIVAAGTGARKKRAVERSLTDINYVNSFSNQGDDFWSNNSLGGEVKPIVKCIGDEVPTYPIPPWKSNIEQGTFRYIPDNGSYRTLKFMYDERRDWFTIRKKLPEKVSTTWHQNCKRLQREVRRQLRKDLYRSEREKENSGNTSSGHNSSRNSMCEPTSGGESTRSNSAGQGNANAQMNRNSPTKIDQVSNHVSLSIKPEHMSEKRVISLAESNLRVKKETRVKSTHSDGAVNQVRKMKTIHERESEPATPMPQYSIPYGSQMLKSASDLFIENFSSRISALEDEIKKDSKWLRKNENDLTRLQNSRAKYREQTRSTFKDNSNQSSSTPRQSVRTEALGCDIFSVKSMTHKELKPLEKTKTYNKLSGGQHGDYNAHETSNPFQCKSSFSNHSPSTNGHHHDFDGGVNGYKSAVDNSKQMLLNTLTGTKINTQNNKKTSKGFSTPSTITLCDNNSVQTNGGNQTRQVDPFRQIPVMVEKTERRETVQNVPALLPEISGKRLEMTSVSHRLL